MTFHQDSADNFTAVPPVAPDRLTGQGSTDATEIIPRIPSLSPLDPSVPLDSLPPLESDFSKNSRPFQNQRMTPPSPLTAGSNLTAPARHTEVEINKHAVLSGPSSQISSYKDVQPNNVELTYNTESNFDNINFSGQSSTETNVSKEDTESTMNATSTVKKLKPTNQLSVIAFICSLLGFLVLPAIAGVSLGMMARNKIARTREFGFPFAVAAIWLGAFYLLATLLVLGCYLWLINRGT